MIISKIKNMLDSNANLYDDAADDTTDNTTNDLLLENQLIKLANYAKMFYV